MVIYLKTAKLVILECGYIAGCIWRSALLRRKIKNRNWDSVKCIGSCAETTNYICSLNCYYIVQWSTRFGRTLWVFLPPQIQKSCNASNFEVLRSLVNAQFFIRNENIRRDLKATRVRQCTSESYGHCNLLAVNLLLSFGYDQLPRIVQGYFHSGLIDYHG